MRRTKQTSQQGLFPPTAPWDIRQFLATEIEKLTRCGATKADVLRAMAQTTAIQAFREGRLDEIIAVMRETAELAERCDR
jgi:hypothetical protein